MAGWPEVGLILGDKWVARVKRRGPRGEGGGAKMKKKEEFRKRSIWPQKKKETKERNKGTCGDNKVTEKIQEGANRVQCKWQTFGNDWQKQKDQTYAKEQTRWEAKRWIDKASNLEWNRGSRDLKGYQFEAGMKQLGQLQCGRMSKTNIKENTFERRTRHCKYSSSQLATYDALY